MTDAKEYFYSRNLSNLWNSVEKVIKKENFYGELMIWTIFQVFHNYARKKFEQNIFSFLPEEIDRNDIEKQYFKNLSEEGWEDELSNYTRTPD